MNASPTTTTALANQQCTEEKSSGQPGFFISFGCTPTTTDQARQTNSTNHQPSGTERHREREFFSALTSSRGKSSSSATKIENRLRVICKKLKVVQQWQKQQPMRLSILVLLFFSAAAGNYTVNTGQNRKKLADYAR